MEIRVIRVNSWTPTKSGEPIIRNPSHTELLLINFQKHLMEQEVDFGKYNINLEVGFDHLERIDVNDIAANTKLNGPTARSPR